MSQNVFSPTTGKRIGGAGRCPTLKSSASGSGSGGVVSVVDPEDGGVVLVDEHEVVVVVVDDGIVVDEVVGVAVEAHGAVVVVEDGTVVDVVVGADVVVEEGFVVVVVDDGTVVVVDDGTVVVVDETVVVVEDGTVVVVVVDSSAAPAVPGSSNKVSTTAITTTRRPTGTAPEEAAWNTPPHLTILLRASRSAQRFVIGVRTLLDQADTTRAFLGEPHAFGPASDGHSFAKSSQAYPRGEPRNT